MEDWAREPFDRIVKHMRQMARFEHVCKYGVANAGRLALAEELFQELERRLSETGEIPDLKRKIEQLDEYKRYADEAKMEYDAGFPFLHQIQVVGLWSVLEAAITDFVAGYLKRYPSAANKEPFSRVKIRLGALLALDDDARARLLVNEAGRQLRLADKSGIAYYEALLSAIGMGGKVASNTKKALYELCQIRHVIVHRGSIADRKLLDACPWLPWKEGDELCIDSDRVERYLQAITAYAKEVIKRIQDYSKVSSENSGSNDH